MHSLLVVVWWSETMIGDDCTLYVVFVMLSDRGHSIHENGKRVKLQVLEQILLKNKHMIKKNVCTNCYNDMGQQH